MEVILSSRALGLGRSWWTVTSETLTLANFYLTTWEEYHTGILFLGYFSGPVEGILIIVAIYIITGFRGMSDHGFTVFPAHGNIGTLFWETRMWTFLGLENVYPFNHIPNLALNESFMCFAALGLVVNIIHACLNVYASRADPVTIRPHTKETNPLSLLLPFLLPVGIQVAWLSHPAFNHSAIIHSALLVPFLCAWGLQFAHQVGKIILAHVTLGGEEFPCWNWIWIWNAIGALDANLPRLFGR